MPPWGRPPGARGGVGKYMEEPEDVYRFQELDSEDEKNGVSLDSGYLKNINGKQYYNPDELYFNDMDLRAWEQRTGPIDGLAYGDDYGYQEDEGFYDETTGVTMPQEEYDDFLFQRVLDKIRLARATGDQNVQLSQEELEVYEYRLLRPRAPAARPQARARPVSMPAVIPVVANVSNAVVSTSSQVSGSGSGSTKSKKPQRRSSIFSSRPKDKKEKDKTRPSSRKRSPSAASETTNLVQPQAPGFVVPGPNGQPVYAPINAYNGRLSRDSAVRSSGSPSRAGSRSTSMSSRHPATPPPRISPPRDMPGGFPSGSPQRYQREPTPPRQFRPQSSSSRNSSLQDNRDHSPVTRSRSSSSAQPPKLVPFPVTDYQYYSAEPLHYYSPGQSSSPQQPQGSQQSPAPAPGQPPYTRRVGSVPADGTYMSMPRRVPVPVQRATVPGAGVQGSYSDPSLGRPGSGLQEELSEEDDPDVLVDVIPQADDKSYKVQTSKSSKESSRSSGKDRDRERERESERRRRSGRTRRK
ncbi:hypothetical protein BCR34DRAFT_601512 [Clohesyomyces aquaticus]|uniref:Uncharacterized protein n=1 Tax=Clohesyomyces aquaticus TaxID=1231657 RepID=A0A1Y1ZML0_9PLEO|nr:hypothetical protein BCR34DRAFT_601512 [Clohesyomyces aquaticus]